MLIRLPSGSFVDSANIAAAIPDKGSATLDVVLDCGDAYTLVLRGKDVGEMTRILEKVSQTYSEIECMIDERTSMLEGNEIPVEVKHIIAEFMKGTSSDESAEEKRPLRFREMPRA